MNKIFCLSMIVGFSLTGCGSDVLVVDAQTKQKTPIDNVVFSAADAKSNLSFTKDQYLKLIANVEQNNSLVFAKGCTEDGVLCFPRAEEHNAIYMEKPTKWTNGFYPGLLWQLLSSKSYMPDFTDAQEKLMNETALRYQEGLISESKRGTTHDLGFILYDSFGEALHYDGLSEENRKLYQQTLSVGRETLSTRYTPEKGVIESWDWAPVYNTQYKENSTNISGRFDISKPFTYPVIVDNMMNLDFLFADSEGSYNKIAFQHAASTAKNHYFYLEDDINKERPVSYHLIDYDNMKPGNWQGLGAVSAWARGQGWSLYGFITVVEAARKADISAEEKAKFEKHLDRIFNSVEHFLKDGYVPLWDFLAKREDAYVLAENVDEKNTVYSKILDLCVDEIPSDSLPYVGYRPIELNTSLFADSTIDKLKTVQSITDEPFVVGDKFYPCGTKPYDLVGREIPRDTSAAALIASGLYRLAYFTADETKRNKYSALADNIMAELTANYLTSKNKSKAYDLGFALAEATGNVPSASEINTSIVYADFYFVEANIRKLDFEAKFTSH